jgi:hypothetical protein
MKTLILALIFPVIAFAECGTSLFGPPCEWEDLEKKWEDEKVRKSILRQEKMQEEMLEMQRDEMLQREEQKLKYEKYERDHRYDDED